MTNFLRSMVSHAYPIYQEGFQPTYKKKINITKYSTLEKHSFIIKNRTLHDGRLARGSVSGL